MKTLNDYIRFVAINIGIQLDEDQVDKLTVWLLNDKKYQEALHELENMIKQVERK